MSINVILLTNLIVLALLFIWRATVPIDRRTKWTAILIIIMGLPMVVLLAVQILRMRFP